MVANLSVGKGEFDEFYDQLCDLAGRAQSIKDSLIRGVDEDTAAFDSVLVAMRMPKDTEEEKVERSRAMQEGYKEATRVPLGTVEQCKAALELCLEMSKIADPQMISDVGTGALMAHAGVQSAAYNVRINLPHIEDETFKTATISTLDSFLSDSGRLAAEVAAAVEEALSG
jgi:formiminotetrahydrofolate cyclodeaminase